MGEAKDRPALAEQVARWDAENEEYRALNAQSRAMLSRGDPWVGVYIVAAFLLGAASMKLFETL